MLSWLARSGPQHSVHQSRTLLSGRPSVCPHEFCRRYPSSVLSNPPRVHSISLGGHALGAASRHPRRYLDESTAPPLEKGIPFWAFPFMYFERLDVWPAGVSDHRVNFFDLCVVCRDRADEMIFCAGHAVLQNHRATKPVDFSHILWTHSSTNLVILECEYCKSRKANRSAYA